MIQQMEIREAIESQVAWLEEVMPANIRRLIGIANDDLYCGPVYLDTDGEPCECFDDGATAFDFKAAIAEIGKWLDDVEDVRISCLDFDEDGEEIEWQERIDGTADEIVRKIVGKELARYVS
jgi:hypothetical protein